MLPSAVVIGVALLLTAALLPPSGTCCIALRRLPPILLMRLKKRVVLLPSLGAPFSSYAEFLTPMADERVLCGGGGKSSAVGDGNAFCELENMDILDPAREVPEKVDEAVVGAPDARLGAAADGTGSGLVRWRLGELGAEVDASLRWVSWVGDGTISCSGMLFASGSCVALRTMRELTVTDSRLVTGSRWTLHTGVAWIGGEKPLGMVDWFWAAFRRDGLRLGIATKEGLREWPGVRTLPLEGADASGDRDLGEVLEDPASACMRLEISLDTLRFTPTGASFLSMLPLGR